MPSLITSQLLNMIQTQFGGVASTAPTSYKFGVSLTIPDQDGTGVVEPADPAYERLTVTNNTTEFVVEEETVVNANPLIWDTATEDWGTVAGVTIYTDADVYRGFFSLVPPKAVGIGGTFRIDAGALIFSPTDDPIDVYIPEDNVGALILTDTAGERWFVSVGTAGELVTTDTDLPGPPAPPTTLAHDGTEFTWTAPVADGGVPVTGYTLHWFADDELVRISIAADAVAYTYSEPGLYYLTADNPIGSSAPSNEITVA